MNLERALREELAALEAAGRLRMTRRLDPGAVDLCTNDYLGLAGAPALIEAAHAATAEHGAGGRAARLLGGGSPLDREVEGAVADWLGAEDALLLPTGYHANLAVVVALAGRGDVVLSDRRNHASLIDAARLSRATVRVFDDLDQLEDQLRAGAGARRRLVLTEGVFSMDGDTPDLQDLGDRCLTHDARLVVDEAHAAGLLGPQGAGAWAAAGASPEALAARVITGGKALGAAGGVIAGSAALREVCVHKGRSFVFTTAVAPAVAGALHAGVRAAREAGEARARCLGLARRLAQALELPAPAAAIVPVQVGDDRRAVAAAAALAEQGFELRAIRPPTVPAGSARLRVATHTFNTEAQVDALATSLRALELPLTAPATPMPPGRALVVVGTDTGIGKTVVAAALLRRAAERGPARYWKPVQTGDDDDTATVHELSGGASCEAPGFRFPLPASPHEAAAAAGGAVDIAQLDARLTALMAVDGTSIIELAGGLHVPLTGEVLQADWLARHRPEVVLVARSGLGTLNHTLLTVEALLARGLRPRTLVLVGEPHTSNRETLARRTGLEILELPALAPLDSQTLSAWAEEADLTP
jgi:8-amino-7-oxononanoate synthase